MDGVGADEREIRDHGMEHVLGFGSADRLVHRAQPAAQDDDRDVLVAEQDVDRADAVGEDGDVGGVQVPCDELGRGAGVEDHHGAVADQFGGARPMASFSAVNSRCRWWIDNSAGPVNATPP